MVYNGGFEGLAGDGDASSTSDPAGWTGANVTLAYSTTSGDIRWGDGYYVAVTDDGSGNGTISQTLTDLPANTTFKVITAFCF